MSARVQSIVAFALPFAIGRVLDFGLGTSKGQEVATKLGNASLATEEGRRLVRQYSTAAAAAAFGLAVAVGQGRSTVAVRRPDRVEAAGSVSELFLAAGALLKVASEFMRDRRTLEEKAFFRVGTLAR